METVLALLLATVITIMSSYFLIELSKPLD